MTVPKGMTVLIGNHEYKAGDKLPANYKPPKNKADKFKDVSEQKTAEKTSVKEKEKTE